MLSEHQISVKLCIKGAYGLNESMCIYIIAKIYDGREIKTPLSEKSMNPEWDTAFQFPGFTLSDLCSSPIIFELWEAEIFGHMLASITFDPSIVLSVQIGEQIEVNVPFVSKDSNQYGTLLFLIGIESNEDIPSFGFFHSDYSAQKNLDETGDFDLIPCGFVEDTCMVSLSMPEYDIGQRIYSAYQLMKYNIMIKDKIKK